MIAHTIYKPQLIFWETTKACPLACKHCRAEAIFEPFPGELTTEESFKLLDEIAQFPKPYPVLILTGGGRTHADRPGATAAEGYGTRNQDCIEPGCVRED